MKLKIYIDTSIVGGYFDDEFKVETRYLFDRLQKGEVIFVVSSVLKKELLKAPQQVQELLDLLPHENLEFVELTQDALDLANNYIAENIVGKNSIDDCYHIAIATINKVDVLASWNFKHIVNFDKIKKYNGVNLKYGYSTIEIRNPKELLKYEND